MKDHQNHPLTTGEFAKLCGTTKETLFHYDAVNLLKPVRVGENGYRYYDPAQFFDFDLIVVLRESGCSLEDIRRHFEKREPEVFAKLLEESEKKLLREQQKLKTMRMFLKNTLELTRKGFTGKTGVPFLEPGEKEFYIATPARGDVLQMPNVVMNMREHLRYCDERNFGCEFAVGSIVLKDSLLQGDFRESYYCTRLEKRQKSSRLYEKPAGLYAHILHRGNYERLPETYRFFLGWIHQNGLTLIGDAFETDLLGYLATDVPEDYVLQLSVQVEDSPTG